MNGTLKLINSTLAFGDPNTSNNPRRRFVDWSTDLTVSVQNPKSDPYTVAPGQALTLFSGAVATSADGTTVWTLTSSPLAGDRYRFTNTAGTAPALRTARSLIVATHSVTMTVNLNQTLTMACTGAFGSVVVGDTLFIAGVTTGDASVAIFNTLNEGAWVVLGAATDALQLGRPAGTSFQGVSETVSVTSALTVLAFSAAGVQIGNGLQVLSGFASTILGNYIVIAVTATWFEVVTTKALPISAVSSAGATIGFYSAAKRFIEVYADQEALVQLNGDTGTSGGVSPWQAGDDTMMGRYSKSGLCYEAVVTNLSTSPMNIIFISAE